MKLLKPTWFLQSPDDRLGISPNLPSNLNLNFFIFRYGKSTLIIKEKLQKSINQSRIIFVFFNYLNRQIQFPFVTSKLLLSSDWLAPHPHIKINPDYQSQTQSTNSRFFSQPISRYISSYPINKNQRWLSRVNLQKSINKSRKFIRRMYIRFLNHLIATFYEQFHHAFPHTYSTKINPDNQAETCQTQVTNKQRPFGVLSFL